MTCLFSIAIHEDIDSVKDMIRNIKFYVPNCYIILHSRRDFIFDENEIKVIPNVFINPQKFITGYVDGSLLHVHLSNYLYSKELSLDYDYFNIFGSNQLFIKMGYEDYIKNFDSCSAKILTKKDLYGKMNYQYSRFYYDNTFPNLQKNECYWCAPEGTYYKKQLLENHIKNTDIIQYHNTNKKFYEKSNSNYREFLRDLSKIFSKFKMLYLFPRNFLKYTYANEEIFFPNINRLTKNQGQNTCFINWENNLNINITDVEKLRNDDSNFFSVKRIERKFDDPIRKFIRETSEYY